MQPTTDRTRQAAVRSALPADADVVFALVEGFATSFRPERAAFDLAYAELLTSADAVVLVAEYDGAVAGYLLGFHHQTFFANGPVSWVEEIATAPAQRGHGIGGALMREFERRAAERGSRLVALATRRASAFYLGLGYEESATYFRKLSGESPPS